MEHWSVGYTLITSLTKNWTKEQIAKNNITEDKMVFSNFHESDHGKSRKLICTINDNTPDFEKNRFLIVNAPVMAEMISKLYDLLEITRKYAVDHYDLDEEELKLLEDAEQLYETIENFNK